MSFANLINLSKVVNLDYSCFSSNSDLQIARPLQVVTSQTYQETPYGGVEDNVYYLRCGNVKLNIQMLFSARQIRTLCAFVP